MNSYYFAERSGKDAKIQIQRLHGSSHAEPLYDLFEKNISCKKVKRAIHTSDPTVPIIHQLQSDPDLLLYDGASPPLTLNQDEPIYMATLYDEPKLHLIQLSSHGLLFNSVSIPYLQRSQSRPQMNSFNSSSNYITKLFSEVTSSLYSTLKCVSPLMDTQKTDDLIEDFLGQPVCWLLVFSKNHYKLVDQVTGAIIGKWVKSHTDATEWQCFMKDFTIAVMNCHYIQLFHAPKYEMLVDNFSYILRKKYLKKRRSAVSDDTFATKLQEQILPQIWQTTRKNDISQKKVKKINYSRISILDGVLFSGLALKLAEKEKLKNTFSDGIDDPLMITKNTTNNCFSSEKTKRTSAILSIIRRKRS